MRILRANVLPSRHLLSTASRFSRMPLSFAGPLGLFISFPPRYIIPRPARAKFPVLLSSSLGSYAYRIMQARIYCPRNSGNSIPETHELRKTELAMIHRGIDDQVSRAPKLSDQIENRRAKRLT